MSLFGSVNASPFGAAAPAASPFAPVSAAPTTAAGSTAAQNKEIEVVSPPDDTVSSLAFSPATVPNTFLVASSFDNHVRCWELLANGQTVPKAQQSHAGPVLGAAWHPDGTKVFTCSADKTAKLWDLGSNSFTQIAQHDAPIRTLHCVQTPSYFCVMTGSWDRTLKFWDTRQATPMLTLQLPERAYAADVLYPMAVVATAGRHVLVYNLENTPSQFKSMESPLKFQSRCVSIFRDKTNREQPAGFALGSIEGRVAIHYLNSSNPKDSFTFKCHRSNTSTQGYQDIFAVNHLEFNNLHGTMATVGSDGRYSFWDKDARTKLRSSDFLGQPISCCTFDHKGQIFAYAVGYDWSRGHEGFDPNKKPRILLRDCADELKPSQARKT